MSLFNDVIVLNMFIPKLVVLGVLCFFITQISIRVAAKYKLLDYFWHPRLIIWLYAAAVYSILTVVILSF
ncbi:DUF1656 domain-containing protein [Plesiomonas shigelloides]|uniref:DUF1656 domain-containing protein n=1 Tax=Plesiomonas shigelloides TaxID=703 RepID=UPI0012618F4E|nr:DUF1656 domain-containing protein [Plesiomonas shigelloides]KAB7688210.1 DUF1656 domain-containing protein [Plesiomonas shigelloides]